ncbi:hypothetical protein ACH4SK_25545 [Streptomyces inhibens]|uniref:hypothetical protein n=1 Tax=Streptomyces inhibens TaxID=2293571 RepID=UPI0037A9ADFF
MYLEYAPEQQRLRTKQRAYISRLGLAAPEARVLVRNPGGPFLQLAPADRRRVAAGPQGNATVILRTEADTADDARDPPGTV